LSGVAGLGMSDCSGWLLIARKSGQNNFLIILPFNHFAIIVLLRKTVTTMKIF
jgi:hypothetical protein